MKNWFAVILLFQLLNIDAQEVENNCVIKHHCPDSTICFSYNKRTEKFACHLNYTGCFFSELNGTDIDVRRKKITTMMAARPKRNFLFHSKENRKYVLLITDKYDMHADSVYSELDSTAIQSIFAHELSHIVSYKEKTNSELLLFGVKYILNRRKIEHSTDEIAIQHGFGPGLVAYTNYIYHSPIINKKYLLRKKKYYLSAIELESKIQETR